MSAPQTTTGITGYNPQGDKSQDYVQLSNPDSGGYVDFLCVGPAKGNATSEFNVGLKVGKMSYDERTHSFWAVLDDFSGGIGHRYLDVRETMGTCWDNQGGVDIRRPQHITLPGPISTAAIPASQANTTFAAAPFAVYQNKLYASVGGTVYKTADGIGSTPWTIDKNLTNTGFSGSLVNFTDATGHIYLVATGGPSTTARYAYSKDGGAWADGPRNIQDAIYWDSKIVGLSLSAATGYQVVFSADATTWNIDNPNDSQAIYNVLASGSPPKFVGVAMAPWGQPAVYFLAASHKGVALALWVLDFYGRQAYEIDIAPISLMDAVVWNGMIALTDGFNCYTYEPGQGGGAVKNISILQIGGAPPSLQSGIFVIDKLLPVGQYLYASVMGTQGPGNSNFQFMVYNAKGWSPIGTSITNQGQAFALWHASAGIAGNQQRRILATQPGTTGGVVITFQIPANSDIPQVGIDPFDPGPMSFITGWIDGGFTDLYGALFSLRIDGWNLTSTETVVVDYRLDNVEGSWTNLGTFIKTGQLLFFDVNKQGIQFRTVQFRITLARGANANQSPEIRALVLNYDKKPHLRTEWTFRIDVNRMIEKQIQVPYFSTPVGWGLTKAASYFTVWQYIKHLWDQKTLLSFIVPELEPSGVNVRITQIPTVFDEFRDAVQAQGYIEVTVLEEIDGAIPTIQLGAPIFI